MGAGPSKERMLYECVPTGDVQTIRSLHMQGASVNWMSGSGNTPLIRACSGIDRLHVARTLIELGADVNYYKPDGLVGTAIQNAAKRGLESTVALLLSHGANPLLSVHESHGDNALDRARKRGYTAIVRAIEDKICFFAGWLRYISVNSPERRIWAVVLPGDPSLSTTIPEQLKFALYRDRQSPKPFNVLSLKKYHVHDARLFSPDPELALSPKSFGTKLHFLSGEKGDIEQLKLLCHTLRGKIKMNDRLAQSSSMATPSRWPPPSPMAASAPLTSQEEQEIAIATAASIQSAVEEGVPLCAVSFGNLEVLEDSSNTSPRNITAGRAPTTGVGTSGLNASCVICVDAPVEVVCIPCGHLAGCMACLTEVKMKKFGCPLCRAPIESIVKFYTV